jgi:uncharacterized LabA/DUF88 family protein
MIRVMIFIDYLNFQISVSKLYSNSSPSLDFNKLPNELCKCVSNGLLMKTYLFHPKPDDFLLQDRSLKSTYDWINGTLRKFNYFEVIEGEYVSRKIDDSIPMDINDHKTYYKIEKGTDINVATQMLTKAFNNAYDVAILVSGDSDYVPVLKQLNNLGKNVIVAGIQGQNIEKLKAYADRWMLLDNEFFKNCTRSK